MNSTSTRHVWIIYFLVVCYALAFQLQQPIEPFLVDTLVGKADGAKTFGQVTAAFGVAQGFGSLVIGYLLDRYGVRFGLLVNYLACALQYGLLSLASNQPDAIFGGEHALAILYLSKVPGAAVAGFLCAQTAIIKVTEEGEERLSALGRLTTAYTIGGVLGPYLGGLLGSSGDYFLGARCAVGMSLLAAGAIFTLPARLDNASSGIKTSKQLDEPKGSWVERAKAVLQMVGIYLAVKLVTGIANNMARSAQPIILKNELQFNEQMMGSLMSAKFAFGGFANAFLLAPLAKLLGGHVSTVVRNCVAMMGATYLLQAMMYGPWKEMLPDGVSGPLFIGISLFLSIFQFSLSTSITADTSRIVSKHAQGTLMGMEHSIFAVAGIMGPLAGTNMLIHHGISGLSMGCAAAFGFVLTLWLVFYKKEVEREKND